MHKELVPGLNQIMMKNIEPGQVALVTGCAGSMKSTFCFAYATSYLQEYHKHGLYITLEQTRESHLQSMESVGFALPKNLIISDYNNMRRDFKEEKEYDIDLVSSIKIMLSKLKKDTGQSLVFFVLDSLNVLYSFSKMKSPRIQIHSLFSFLRENNLISLIIKETREPDNLINDFDVQETFLVDGIINLGLIDEKNRINRYLQVTKMRGIHHDLRKYEVDIKDNSLMILSPIYE
jgi:circadian clock protein KaiC